MTGVGLIVIVKLTAGALVQPLRVAVALIVPVTGDPVVLVAAVKLISPVLGPAPNPIAGLLLVQLTTEPGVLVIQATDTASPAQNTNGPGLVNTG